MAVACLPCELRLWRMLHFGRCQYPSSQTHLGAPHSEILSQGQSCCSLCSSAHPRPAVSRALSLCPVPLPLDLAAGALALDLRVIVPPTPCPTIRYLSEIRLGHGCVNHERGSLLQGSLTNFATSHCDILLHSSETQVRRSNRALESCADLTDPGISTTCLLVLPR